MNWFKRKPVQSTLVLGLSITIVLTVALWNGLGRHGTAWSWLLAWIAAINSTTFGTYGIDKFQARNAGWRIPERSLLVLGFLGGTVGALLAMNVFRHKTVKHPFRVAFWLLSAAQLSIAGIVIGRLLT